MNISLRYLLVAVLGITSLSWFASFRSQQHPQSPAAEIGQQFLAELSTFHRDLTRFEQRLVDVSEDEVEAYQEEYLRLRQSYKKIEPMLAYLQPELTTQRINGAPLPKIDPMEEVAPVVIQPKGLQVIDEKMFTDDFFAEYDELSKLLRSLNHELATIEKFLKGALRMNDRQVFEASRQGLIRIFTLGLSGFDTPGSVNALRDSYASLHELARVFNQYEGWMREEGEEELFDEIQQQYEMALLYLNQPTNFETFDRMTFLRDYLDPLYGLLLDAHLALDIETMYQISPARPAVNYMARHIFSDEFLNKDAYLKLDAKSPSTATLTLGQYLFFDPVLSESNQRSCASCHHPNRAFTDGQRKSMATEYQGTVERNAPTLINAVYADRYFHDLRSSELETQVDHVIASKKEFNTDYPKIIRRLKSSPEYVDLFYEAYPRYKGTSRPPINANTVKGALAAYVSSLTSINSPFDRYARGETDEIEASVINGFNIFMGKGVCGTCHFAPTFHGTVPPLYKESESEVLGVPAEPVWANAQLDPDYGRIKSGVPLFDANIFEYSFKTPTVRNVALTAPYMHNGVYDSLEQVLRFYNVGGGDGIGIHLENQTLPFDNLNLTDSEISDVISFMEALTDTTGTTGVPHRLPAFPDDSPYRERVIGGVY